MKKFVMTALVAIACTAGAYASTSNALMLNRKKNRDETKSKKHHMLHHRAAKGGTAATPMK